MNALDLLTQRSSVSSKHLTGPGPSEVELQALLRLAMRVPDHGKLAPWRFLLIQGDAKSRMCDLLHARRLALEPSASPETLAKDAARFSFAPSIVCVIASPLANHKIPVVEQLASASAVCMQLLNACSANGFAAQWLTGWAAYDASILSALGLSASEQISGFIHIGNVSQTHGQPQLERPRANLSEKLRVF